MRGYLNKLTTIALFSLLGAGMLAAQSSGNKPQSSSQDKTSSASQDKSSTSQDKPSQPQESQDKPSADSQDKDKSSDSPEPWYSKINPAKLVKHYKSANDQLASNGQMEDKLSKQLRIQKILGEDQEMQVVCSDFRDLPNCIAVLRLSKSLPVEFTCLKWNVTGVKPKNAAESCAGPSSGKAMPLDRSIDLLKPSLVKPSVDDKEEASKALKKAHDDIHDASS